MFDAFVVEYVDDGFGKSVIVKTDYNWEIRVYVNVNVVIRVCDW